MVMINRATREITLKIVYYGPGLCGKTTNLERIFAAANPERRGKLLTVATETDRTLFFDFLPMELGTIRGMRVRVQLYTVPGQVFYDATRRIVLRGSDGVVFVADSQAVMMDANLESVENLKHNLRLNNLDPETIPLVFQYNKRDLPGLSSVEELEEKLNWRRVPHFLSVATTGEGVGETLRKIIEEVIRDLHRKEESLRTAVGASRSPAPEAESPSPREATPVPPLPVEPPPPEEPAPPAEQTFPSEPPEEAAPPAERTFHSEPPEEGPPTGPEPSREEAIPVAVVPEEEISGEDLEVLDLDAVEEEPEPLEPASAPPLGTPEARALEAPEERPATEAPPEEASLAEETSAPPPSPSELEEIRAELTSLALGLASLTRRADALRERVERLLRPEG